MNKKLQLFSLSILPFIYAGCVPKTTPIMPQQTHTDSSLPVTQQPRESLPPSQTASQNIRYHTFPTVQGSKVIIGERSNGFLFPQYRGKIVLLEIFGKTCHFCLEEMPFVSYIKDKYKDKIQIIAIQAQEPMSPQKTSELIHRFNMTYPIIEGADATDLLSSIREKYEWYGVLPYKILIKDGVSEYFYAGEANKKEIEENIQSLL